MFIYRDADKETYNAIQSVIHIVENDEDLSENYNHYEWLVNVVLDEMAAEDKIKNAEKSEKEKREKQNIDKMEEITGR